MCVCKKQKERKHDLFFYKKQKMIIFLNKLPIPNLRVYSMFSTLLLSVLLFYSQKIYYDLKNNVYKSEKFDPIESIEKDGYFKATYLAITNEPWCVWVMINFCYCCLLLFSKVIQGIVFGKLRAVENQVSKKERDLVFCAKLFLNSVCF